jgi:hypothetical protein
MIKKYNQFVKGKTNEEFEYDMEAPVREMPTLGNPSQAPVRPDVKPDTTERPAPGKPTPFRRPSTEPGTKAEFEGEFEGEEEEEVGYDKYTMALKTLADAAGVEFDENNKMVIINGKEVTFPAEDEKYHIKGFKKGLKSVEDVLANVGSNSNIREEETSFEETESELAKRDLEDEMGTFESKSYRSSRLKRLKK